MFSYIVVRLQGERDSTYLSLFFSLFIANRLIETLLIFLSNKSERNCRGMYWGINIISAAKTIGIFKH